MNKDITYTDIFNLPLRPGDTNLVELISIHLNTTVNQASANIFLSMPSIASVINLNNLSQRAIINRYFTELFLMFRSKYGINVNNVIPFLANDGLTEDWITVMKEFVIPFIKEHDVMVKFYNPVV